MSMIDAVARRLRERRRRREIRAISGDPTAQLQWIAASFTGTLVTRSDEGHAHNRTVRLEPHVTHVANVVTLAEDDERLVAARASGLLRAPDAIVDGVRDEREATFALFEIFILPGYQHTRGSPRITGELVARERIPLPPKPPGQPAEEAGAMGPLPDPTPNFGHDGAARTVRVQLRDADTGRPVAGEAWLDEPRAAGGDGVAPSPARRVVPVGAQGASIRVPAGDHSLTFTAPGYAPAPAHATATNPHPFQLDVPLRREGTPPWRYRVEVDGEDFQHGGEAVYGMRRAPVTGDLAAVGAFNPGDLELPPFAEHRETISHGGMRREEIAIGRVPDSFAALGVRVRIDVGVEVSHPSSGAPERSAPSPTFPPNVEARLYDRDGALLHTFRPPEGEPGDLWVPFAFVKGRLVQSDAVSAMPAGGAAGDGGRALGAALADASQRALGDRAAATQLSPVDLTGERGNGGSSGGIDQGGSGVGSSNGVGTRNDGAGGTAGGWGNDRDDRRGGGVGGEGEPGFRRWPWQFPAWPDLFGFHSFSGWRWWTLVSAGGLFSYILLARGYPGRSMLMLLVLAGVLWMVGRRGRSGRRVR